MRKKKKNKTLKNKGHVTYGANDKLPALNDDDDNIKLGVTNPYEDQGRSCNKC